MKNLLFFSIILLSAVLFIQGCSGSDDSSQDQKSLQGDWTGQIIGEKGKFMLTISGSKFNIAAVDSEIWYKGTFVLNENITPKQIDFLIDDCFMDQYKGTTTEAIYKIENDSFSFASYEPGTLTRPAEFNASDGSVTFNFTRQ
jgi:uncharacterized protein (TIGR03067 family)